MFVLNSKCLYKYESFSVGYILQIVFNVMHRTMFFMFYTIYTTTVRRFFGWETPDLHPLFMTFMRVCVWVVMEPQVVFLFAYDAKLARNHNII